MVACFVLFSCFCLLLSGHPTGDCLYDSLLTRRKAVTRVLLVISLNFSYPEGPLDRTGLSLIKHNIRFGKIRTHDVMHTNTINNQSSKFDLTLFVAPSLTATSQVKQPTGRSPSAPDCQPAAGSASKYLESEFLSITMSGISLSLSLPLLSYFLSMCTAVYVLLSQAK